MRNLNDAGGSRGGLGPAALGTLFNTKGFTDGDLRLLQEAHQSGVANRGWGRSQFATNAFSEYLAIWSNDAAKDDPPTVVMARFWKTGTYALLIRGRIVASDASLRAILPALLHGHVAATTEDA